MSNDEKLDEAFEAGRRAGRSEMRREAYQEMSDRSRVEADFWRAAHDALLERVADLSVFKVAPVVIVSTDQFCALPAQGGKS